MIFQVLLAVLVARLKGYPVGKTLAHYAFYPFYAVELLYILFQVNIFLSNFSFIAFAPYLKSASLYALLLPIFLFKLYKPALAGSGCIVAGTLLNNWVISANGGRMPVYPTLSYLTGYFSKAALENDTRHVLGSSATKLKILTDYIDVGFSVLSIGDVLIHVFVFIIFFFSMKSFSMKFFNEKHSEGTQPQAKILSDGGIKS